MRIGRHFWIEGRQIIIGRNKEENQILEAIFKKGDILIKPKSFIGPSALLRGEKIDSQIVQRIKELIFKFSSGAKNLDISELNFKTRGRIK